MKVKPLRDGVLLRRIEEQEVKKGGIIIPDTAKEKPQTDPDRRWKSLVKNTGNNKAEKKWRKHEKKLMY